MSIPLGFYQGNRSEYLAIPALSKLGFTIPVPRQEDHFGVDFIVHLATIEDKTVSPLGKSFSIQIKSNEDPLAFNNQVNRECLSNMTIPFFLGVVSRETLTLTIYSTLGRVCFFWKEGTDKDFEIIIKDTGNSIEMPDYNEGKVWTGKPILKISIEDPATPEERIKEIQNLQETINDWIQLENDALSLKEQNVPILWFPTKYETNKPFEYGIPLVYSAFANPRTLPNICIASQKTLTSLSFYLKDILQPGRTSLSKQLNEKLELQANEVESVLKRNMEILTEFQKPKKGGDEAVTSGDITL